MDVLVGHSAANRMRRGAATRVRREEIPRGPVYYDYTEHFEHEEFVEPNIEHVPVGFASPIKTVVEEGEHVVAPSGTRESSSTKNSNSIERSELPDIAELPASPVGRRITRELIRSGLEANSTTGDAVSTTTVLAAKGGFGHSQRIRNQSTNGPGDGGNCGSFILPTGLDRSCHSVLSQTEQSMLNSSTLQFAVQCSIPAMTGVGPDVRPESEHEPVPKSPGSPEKNTDDGMSELLAGYQHTDSKQEDIIVPESETQPKVESVIVNGSDRTTQHAPNSSDEQSFKSCTDVLESIVPRSYEAQSSSASDSTSCALSRPKLPVKDPDAYSFQTCKNAATPDGTKSVLSSPLSSATADADMQCKRPTPGLPSTNSLLGIRKTVFGRHHSSFSIASKLRGSPKPSMKNGSMSTLGSSSTLGVPHQPPSVPPRESSASSEAQRLNAVGTFLMRRVIPVRFSKDKKLLPDAASEKKNSTDTVTGQCLQPSQNLAEPSGSPQKPPRISKVPEGVPGDRNALAKEHRPSNSSPTNDLRVTRVVVPPLHYHSLSTPSTGIIEAAAVPSPQDVSAKGRTYSLSTSAPLSLEQHRRDSQSTTHLSWAGRRPFGLPSASVSEPRLPLPSVQENTTTDLRLSVYKYNAPQRYLHDLKEDSHEDSSLNTSASNLKNSHFRFPHSNGIVVRTSVDDVVALAAKASLGSRRGSVVDDGHGLPSLEFSQADLFEKFKDALGDIRFSRSSGRTQLDLFDANEGSLQRGGQNGLERRRVNSLDGVESLGHSEQATGVDIAGSKRAYSPESLIAEIDQVSIPSVTQLSQRVTEMLPTLLLAGPHEVAELGDLCEFPAEKEIMEHAIDEIHHVHPPAQKRSSARLRPVRGASGLVIMEDDVYEEMTSKRGSRIVDDQCIRELEFEVEADEAGSHANNKGKDTAHAPTRHPSSIAELRAPSPAVLCLETCAASNRALRKSVESALSSTRSPGSFVSTRTATDTRPWNFDRNYPWATTAAPSVDISLPRPAALKQSPRPGPSHLRNTLSDATSSTFTSARTPTTSPTGEDSTFNANRQAHRLSIFGRNGDQAHAVGERYPTSALSPPTAIFRDHLSTCDTSDDEDFTTSRKTNRLTLRKRFSSAARTTTTPLITRTKVNPADLASPAPAHEQSSSTLQDRAGEARAFTSHRHTFRDAEGMRVSAYHRHRIVNNLKRWWHKGGELIRSISQRGSNRRRDVVQSAGN
jgi:serine/arginine repetitive matrix protein 2